jgi:4,5-dihydroxyphthalate decarboxylase
MTSRIRVGLTTNPLTKPLLDGTIQSANWRWEITTLDPAELFFRQLHGDVFDVFEMSLASHFRLASLGIARWVALPIFTNRRLAHLGVLVTDRSAIETPTQLVGRRIGVPEYQQTSAVWSRGVLAHDFGVDARDIHWLMERGTERSHASGTNFTVPPGVRLDVVAEHESIGSLLLNGQIDGTLLYIGRSNIVDRSPKATPQELGCHPLFDEATELARFGGRLWHANHCVAVRAEIAIDEFIADVMATFTAARDAALGPDISQYPYGFTANAEMLQTLADYCREQGIAEAHVDVADAIARID